MRRTYFLIILIVFFYASNGQEQPILNVGVGWPFYTKNENAPHYQLKVRGYPFVSIEKSLFIKVNNINRIGISPGLGFWGFSEDHSSGGLGGTSTQELKHFSFHGYAKLSIREIFSKRSKNLFNFGVISGMHLFTKTKGETSCTSMQPDWCNSIVEIKKSGSDFFNTVYYGFFMGLQPKISSAQKKLIRPNFEIYYYPNFIKPSYDSEGVIKVAVLLEIHPKRKTIQKLSSF